MAQAIAERLSCVNFYIFTSNIFFMSHVLDNRLLAILVHNACLASCIVISYG